MTAPCGVSPCQPAPVPPVLMSPGLGTAAPITSVASPLMSPAMAFRPSAGSGVASPMTAVPPAVSPVAARLMSAVPSPAPSRLQQVVRGAGMGRDNVVGRDCVVCEQMAFSRLFATLLGFDLSLHDVIDEVIHVVQVFYTRSSHSVAVMLDEYGQRLEALEATVSGMIDLACVVCV